MQQADEDISPYQRIGGREGVERLVLAFYTRVLADGELAPFFFGRELKKLRHMQHEFFSAALGGDVEYTGRPIIHAHMGLGISSDHFRRFSGHLLDTLGDFPLSDDERYQLIARIDTYMDDVVAAGTGLGS